MLDDAAKRTETPRATIGRWRKDGPPEFLEQLQRIGFATGDSLDWIAGFDVPRTRWGQELAHDGVTREQAGAAILGELRAALASRGMDKLDDAWVALLEARGDESRSLLARAVESAVNRTIGNARQFIAQRLVSLAEVLERAHANERPNLNHIVFKGAERAGRLLRMEAAAVRSDDFSSGHLADYFELRPAVFELLSDRGLEFAQTRFPVPGGVAWGCENRQHQDVWCFGKGFETIVHHRVARPGARSRLFVSMSAGDDASTKHLGPAEEILRQVPGGGAILRMARLSAQDLPQPPLGARVVKRLS